MYEEMRLAGLADPVYRQTSGSVRVTLSSTPVDRALEATGRSRPVVIRQLKALQEAGVLDWIGHSPKDPRAYWALHVE